MSVSGYIERTGGPNWERQVVPLKISAGGDNLCFLRDFKTDFYSNKTTFGFQFRMENVDKCHNFLLVIQNISFSVSEPR